jgi:hypothetical protein
MGGPEAIDPTRRRFRPDAYFRCAWANHLDGTGCSTALSLQQQATWSLSQAAERLLHEDAHSHGVDRVAPVTNGNQVLLAVFSVLAAKLHWHRHRSRCRIARRSCWYDSGSTLPVWLRREPPQAATPTCCRSCCFSASGRRLMRRKIEESRAVGFSSSRCAPARKSAQIISRQ